MKHKMYILVVGSRTFDHYSIMRDILSGALETVSKEYDIVIVSGGARGADKLAERFANEFGYELKVFPADWNKYGKCAGYIRNEEMHKFISGHGHRGVVAFWDGESRGTYSNVGLCEKYHNNLILYNYKSGKYKYKKY